MSDFSFLFSLAVSLTTPPPPPTKCMTAWLAFCSFHHSANHAPSALSPTKMRKTLQQDQSSSLLLLSGCRPSLCPSICQIPRVMSNSTAFWTSHLLHAPCVSLPFGTLFIRTVSRDDIFLRSTHFYQYFLSLRWWFSMSFKSFSLPFTIINLYLLLGNYSPHCSVPIGLIFYRKRAS